MQKKYWKLQRNRVSLKGMTQNSKQRKIMNPQAREKDSESPEGSSGDAHSSHHCMPPTSAPRYVNAVEVGKKREREKMR